MALIRQPHTVSVVTPDVSQSSATNVTTKDYVVPPATERDVKGTFQTRGGDVIEDEAGKVFSYDGMFYTLDKDINIDDLMIVSLPGLSQKFIVVGVEPKYAIDGRFTHMQIRVTKEDKR